MVKKGLLIEYEYCTGCHTCELACKQEHNFPTGVGGITVKEIITENGGRIRVDYLPFTTQHCDLCAARTEKGEQPSCVKHCQAGIMWFGTIEDLANIQKTKTRSVLFAPLKS